MAPLVSQAAQEGLLEPLAIDQTECYDAALQWARTEGRLSDYPLPPEELARSLAVMDGLPKPSLDKTGKW